jgi:DNA-binding IclR family transcriptional regulator
LDETEERGWAAAIEEAEAGVAAVAAVIRVGGQVVGTVSIAGPIHHFSPLVLPQLAEQVKATAEELSQLWPYRIASPSAQTNTSRISQVVGNII